MVGIIWVGRTATNPDSTACPVTSTIMSHQGFMSDTGYITPSILRPQNDRTWGLWVLFVWVLFLSTIPLGTIPLSTGPLSIIPLSTIPLSTVSLTFVHLSTGPLSVVPLSTVHPGRARLPQCALHRLRVSPKAFWPPLQKSDIQHTCESCPWVISLVPYSPSPRPLLYPLHPVLTSNGATDPRKGSLNYKEHPIIALA